MTDLSQLFETISDPNSPHAQDLLIGQPVHFDFAGIQELYLCAFKFNEKWTLIVSQNENSHLLTVPIARGSRFKFNNVIGIEIVEVLPDTNTVKVKTELLSVLDF